MSSVPINFPLIKVCNKKYYKLSNFYNKKIDEFKIKAPEGLVSNEVLKEIDPFSSTTYKEQDGVQFHNLLDINQDLKKEQLKNIVCKELAIKNTKLRYHYFHFFEYYRHGKMGWHKHYEKEDFVCILYLNTCKSGETIFYLNDFNQDSKDRSMVKIKPEEGKLIIFSSLILHEGLATGTNKRLAVGGFKLNR